MEKNPLPKGWQGLVSNLRADLEKIAPGLHVTEVSVGKTGRLQFYYSASGLTQRQQVAVDSRVKKAEDAAWQTCVVCGRLGTLAYIAVPILSARVFCEEHKPNDWNAVE